MWVILLALATCTTQAASLPPDASADILVQTGPLYESIPDFSTVGYHGGDSIPDVPTVARLESQQPSGVCTTLPGIKKLSKRDIKACPDDTDRIQREIDQVSLACIT